MSRFSEIVERIREKYPTAGDTRWELGAEALGKHDNWNRIVAFTTDGTIKVPDQSATRDRTDTHVRTRIVDAVFAIHGSSYSQTESRLHALISAIDEAMGATSDVIGDMRERWYRGNAARTGRRVDLIIPMGLRVMASDFLVVEDDVEPGQGFPTTLTTSIGLTGQVDETIAGTVVLPVD